MAQTIFRTASYTDKGGRAYNEDSILDKAAKNSHCLILADGLGGHGGGDVASKEVCRTISEGWSGSVSQEELTNLVNQAHRNVQSLQRPDCAMKSTVTALLVEKSKAVWAHVGDSRIYHFLNGRLVFQTRDHSASQLAVMLGDITTAEIRHHEDRSTLLRALGESGDVKIEAASEFLAQGSHAFLLCSDGFWEYVLEDEMEWDLSIAKSPEEWLKLMLLRLRERIGPDNDNNSAAVLWMTVN